MKLRSKPSKPNWSKIKEINEKYLSEESKHMKLTDEERLEFYNLQIKGSGFANQRSPLISALSGANDREVILEFIESLLDKKLIGEEKLKQGANNLKTQLEKELDNNHKLSLEIARLDKKLKEQKKKFVKDVENLYHCNPYEVKDPLEDCLIFSKQIGELKSKYKAK